MRIAIFSDVHGNLTALEAVLADIKQQSPDWIIFAGDLCAVGAHPAECAARVRDVVDLAVYGNTDEWLHTPPPIPDGIDDKQRQARQLFRDLLQWTWDRLGADDQKWIENLPFSVRVSPTAPSPFGGQAASSQDLLVAHANPVDVMQVIFPTAAFQEGLFGEVKKEQSDADLAPLFEGVEAGVFAFGHLHIPNIRQWGDITLANISSVNIPHDQDSHAKYGLLDWSKSSGWAIEHRRIAYDVQKELDIIATRQPPDWESMIERTKG